MDYTDRTTCIIFGDGAVFVLLEPTTEDVGVMDSMLKEWMAQENLIST